MLQGASAARFRIPAISISLNLRGTCAKTKTILMLAEDLPNFCEHVLQYMYHRMPGDYFYIRSCPEARPVTAEVPKGINRVYVDIRVMSSYPRTLRPEENDIRHRALLAPFQLAQSACQVVRIRGVEEDVAANITHIMTNRIIYPDAAKHLPGFEQWLLWNRWTGMERRILRFLWRA